MLLEIRNHVEMDILLLAEGDSETWDAWSGSAKSLVDRLRDAGQHVQTGDVDLYGLERLAVALRSFAPSRVRWRTRYRYQSETSFRRRSRRAESHIRRSADRTDVIAQIGATFESRGRAETPYVVIADSNIAMARRGARTGFSTAAVLSDSALDRIAAREERVYRNALLIFPLSDELRRSFVEDFAIPDDRVVTIHGGPNMQLGLPSAPEQKAEKRNDPTILFVGREFHRKGGDVLIDAFRLVREAVPEARLLIAGAQRCSSEPGIEWPGDLDKRELVQLYHSAHVFCLPTRFEPYGVSFLEAMHFGLPCVGTDAWAVPELIDDGATGFLVPPDDVKALADRLLVLLRDLDLAERMGNTGRNRAVRNFTWEASVTRMLAALRREGLG